MITRCTHVLSHPGVDETIDGICKASLAWYTGVRRYLEFVAIHSVEVAGAMSMGPPV